MKGVVFAVGVLALGGCVVPPPQDPYPAMDDMNTTSQERSFLIDKQARDMDALMTNQAVASYRNEYLKATAHKAFAQSDSGAWSWKSNRTSIEHAINNALIGCRANNKRSEAEYPCKIINIDGEWTGMR